ncbi:MAG: hypothetical protein J6A21_08630 [Lentisphaeria bacterium]|nr:hypothetical protein [Lentisphaeria bacterium]
MKHYNFREIKEKGSCIDFAEKVLGAKVTDNRCVAVWRGGERDSVSIDKDKWYDHASQQGGGLIELCAIAKFGSTDFSSIQLAQEFLGNFLQLEEVKFRKVSSGHNRHDELLQEGYTETARYNYVDLSGKLLYFVCRMEHPTKKKEFVQGTPDHWGISDVTPIPYNWQAVNASPWCVIVEGEKDVETLKKIGVPATTNSGGAKKWRKEFAEYLRGKQVIILPDNDEVGKEHGLMIADDLLGVASGIKIVQCSKLPKGDVTDYFEKENGTWDTLSAMIKEAPAYEKKSLSGVEAAKESNLLPFRNYTTEEKELGKRKIKEKLPRKINDLVKDLHIRLLGAPFRVGEELFDQDRESGKINYIYDASDLFSWIARKINNVVDWGKIDGTVTKAEFFSALKSEATAYNAISFVPDYPPRDDVFYTHPPLPPPSENHSVFWKFVDFFNPMDDINRSLLSAFIMAPIFYKPMVARPLWIIDSPDGQGSGKSMIPEMLAFLYGENMLEGKPIDVSLYDLERNYQEVVKRIISTKGRNARILRLDNVTGILHSSNLAMLVTSGSISGRASYGKGEESRPNNLTYVVTINGATVDTDIASRSYYIMIKKPKMNPNWTGNVIDYIVQNRFQIFSDIIDLISSHRTFDIPPVTRMPAFETTILQAACGTPEQYQRVMETLLLTKEETNMDEELAKRIEEEIVQKLLSVKSALGSPVIDPRTDKVFIRTYVLENWFKNETFLNHKYPAEVIRNLARIGILANVDPNVKRFPPRDHGNLKRRSGILWNYKTEGATRIIGMENHDAIEITEG